ncbi:hypothetical protein [Burkholderia thailandensis]|uniref:hypothetical protein n=1 Tax=Burkholderia thailandensis TaxID=57975 RepID=UPI0010D0ED98|nr:hypothetical protein [Burkholderia thailandensis]MCS3394476.1 hypothetical protein [Burkholderia thailandensis]MCS6455101.1 hypothetical protein [Burkholderia thailandensis]MCS6466748.1 hypothetical protein [Burkholderia thailandensis]MCZ2902982.1 hypothetical protein [Burkholderia thailandensis]MDD1483660.1 hypothetical protein [Burkholderia thailandensis]
MSESDARTRSSTCARSVGGAHASNAENPPLIVTPPARPASVLGASSGATSPVLARACIGTLALAAALRGGYAIVAEAACGDYLDSGEAANRSGLRSTGRLRGCSSMPHIRSDGTCRPRCARLSTT